jgi:hypothetical protein
MALGQTSSKHLEGVFKQVPLPVGSFFTVAGRATELGLSVDQGSNGDAAAFCAALSP